MLFEAEISKTMVNGLTVEWFDQISGEKIGKSMAPKDAYIIFVPDNDGETWNFYLFQNQDCLAEMEGVGAFHNRRNTKVSYTDEWEWSGKIFPL